MSMQIVDNVCNGCNAAVVVEHHDDDCPPGCASDGCMHYQMNPLNDDGYCEGCEAEQRSQPFRCLGAGCPGCSTCDPLVEMIYAP